MFEVLEQLDWRPPDFVVVPGGNLGNVSAFGKALEELVGARLIPRAPRLVVVQAEGANPFVNEQFQEEMAKRREKLHLTRNDVQIGCPLCLVIPKAPAQTNTAPSPRGQN